MAGSILKTTIGFKRRRIFKEDLVLDHRDKGFVRVLTRGNSKAVGGKGKHPVPGNKVV